MIIAKSRIKGVWKKKMRSCIDYIFSEIILSYRMQHFAFLDEIFTLIYGLTYQSFKNSAITSQICV